MILSSRRNVAIAGVFAAGMLAAATACGSSGSDSGSASAGSSSASSPSSSSSGPSSAGAATGAVHTVSDKSLGTIVVDGKGFTLYRFDADSASPSASHCTGTCAALWPAAPAVGASSVQGVDAKLVGSVAEASGGGRQLTIAGWPVYTYAQDSGPGQTSGQGADGTWWAVTASGARAGAGQSASTTSTTSSGSGGYGY